MRNVWLFTHPYISIYLPSFGSLTQATWYDVSWIVKDLGCESAFTYMIFLIIRSILSHLSQFTLHLLVLVGNIF